VHAIESASIDFVRSLFDAVGWAGIVVAMAIESACIPLPSEVVMPLAGWLLVAEHGYGWGGVLLAALFGAIGNVIGSTIAYGVGAWGGRPLLERHGKWLLITHRDLDLADRWFAERGELVVFVGRLLPVVRTFISLPAGIARMPFVKFVTYTFLGAFIWCIPLTAVGYHWGPKWEEIREKARFLDYPIAAVLVVFIAWYVWHKLSELRRQSKIEHA
jgi:membrane protein DedA with SNARE-associated domain